jgi:hypothetical protein
MELDHISDAQFIRKQKRSDGIIGSAVRIA